MMYMYPKVSETHPFVQGVQKCMLVIRKSKEHLRMRAESSKQSLSFHIWPQLATCSVDSSIFSSSADVCEHPGNHLQYCSDYIERGSSKEIPS